MCFVVDMVMELFVVFSSEIIVLVYLRQNDTSKENLEEAE